jgi:hypothetical protein
MSSSKWIGQINGSRVGNLLWRETEDGSGELTVGQRDGNVLTLRTQRDAENANRFNLTGPDDSNQAVGYLELEDASQGHRVGTWRLADRSTGTFEVILKEFGGTISTNPVEQSQLLIANKEVPLGAITLYRSDLNRIIAELESYFDDPVTVVIRANESEQVIVRNVVEYLARGDLPDMVKELTLAVEKDATRGLKKIVTIALSDDLDSKITVSSPDELWTEAVAQRLSRFMEQFTSTFTGFLRRHGLNVNFLMLLVLLVALPEFERSERIILVVLAIGTMLLIARTHKLVPFARVYLDPDRARRPYAKELPSVILGAVAALAVSVFSALPKITDWITNAAQWLANALAN